MAFLDLNSLPRLSVMLITGIMTLNFSNAIQADNPYTGSTSAFVSYANAATNTDLHESPTVRISFNGSDHHVPFIMDTGSVGIVASEDIFQPAPGAKNLGPGKQFYSSSGIIEEGTWWTATQNIYDADGNLLATSEVPVLRVKKIKCSRNARDCTPTNHPQGISVMGVGFARESKTQPRGTPEYNAFLNLQTVLQGGELKPLPVDWVNGYVVTSTGVDLGLTSANTLNAGWVKLLPWPQYSTPKLPEWMPAPMTIDANGVSGDGNILMDTGVTAGFLTPPPQSDVGPLVDCSGTSRAECVPSGKTFGIYLPDQTNPVAFYTFTVGEVGNLMKPEEVHVEAKSKVFFNTSRHVLGGINFIYDNSNGYIGYIWNGLSGSDVGYVIPAVAETATTLATSANPASFGKTITFTAKVVSVDDPSLIPTGRVSFYIDKVHEGIAQVDKNGYASFSVSKLPPLKHTVQAKYSGDSTFTRSSATITQRIKPPTCF